MRRAAAGWPPLHSKLRTPCVATQLEGRHAPNALPKLAAANVNCRILPNDTVENVLAELKKVVAGDQVMVSTYGAQGWDKRMLVESFYEANFFV